MEKTTLETIEIDDEQETAEIKKAITQMERAANLKEIETAKFTKEEIMESYLIGFQQRCHSRKGLVHKIHHEVGDNRLVLKEGGLYNFFEDPIKWGCYVSPLDIDFLPHGRRRYGFEEDLVLEGICEDVSIHLYTEENKRGAYYNGILRRHNGERVPFTGYGILEAKAIVESAEKKTPVNMFCTINASVEVRNESMWEIERIDIDDRVRITNNFDPLQSGGDVKLAK